MSNMNDFPRTARVAPEKTAFRPVLPSRFFAGALPEKRMKPSYSDLLKDVRWQKKRLETLESTGWACESCGTKANTLHVHHKRYVKGRKPWEYDRNELAVLCEACHSSEHDDGLLLDQVLARAPIGMIGGLVGLITGFLDGSLDFGGGDYFDDKALIEQARQTAPGGYELGIIASLLGGCERKEWESFIREFAQKHSVTPTVRHMIERWDEEADAP